jgi:hypothetical protein
MTPRADRLPFARNAPPRSRAVSSFVKLVVAHLLCHQRVGVPLPLDEVIQRYWPDEGKELQLLQRAATSPLTTGFVGAQTGTTSKEFLLALGPASAGSALMRRGLMFEWAIGGLSVKVPAVVTAASGSGFVLEGTPITVEQFALTGALLAPCSLTSISVFSRETFRLSLPSLEMMVHTVLAESAGLRLDSVMFSNSGAVSGVSPAGLLLGLSSLTPSTTTPLSEALYQDAAALAAAVAPVAGNSPIVFVASPRQAVGLKLRLDPDQFDVLVSGALTDKTVLCVATNAIASAVAPTLNIDVSAESALHMEDTSPAMLAAGTGPTVATPIRSLYQTDTLACRLNLDVSWALRHPSGLSFMTNVSW